MLRTAVRPMGRPECATVPSYDPAESADFDHDAVLARAGLGDHERACSAMGLSGARHDGRTGQAKNCGGIRPI